MAIDPYTFGYLKATNPNALAAECLAEVMEDFSERIAKDETLGRLWRKLETGVTDYNDADMFSLLVGKHLGNSMYEVLPGYTVDDRLAREVAEYVIGNGLRVNYEEVVNYAATTQKGLNERAKLGLNAVEPEYDYEREQGLVDYITEEKYSQRAKSFRDAVQQNAQHYVDETARVNADFQYKSGLPVKVRRIAAWHCCKWCDRLAGTYDYADIQNTGNDVWRRHSNCNCTIIYDPGTGKVQDVTAKKRSKAWYNSDKEVLEARKLIGVNTDTLTPEDRVKKATIQEMQDKAYRRIDDATQLRLSDISQFEKWQDEYYNLNSDIELTKQNLKAINDYTAGSYSAINAVERYEPGSEGWRRWERCYGNLEPYKAVSDKLSAELSEFRNTSPINVRRVVGDVDYITGSDSSIEAMQAKIGEIYHEKGFTSTTVATDATLPFGGGKPTQTTLDIYVPENTRGAYVYKVSDSPAEFEYLIDKNTNFRIIDAGERQEIVKKIDGSTENITERYMVLEVIND